MRPALHLAGSSGNRLTSRFDTDLAAAHRQKDDIGRRQAAMQTDLRKKLSEWFHP